MKRQQLGSVVETGTKTKTWTGYYYVIENGKRKQKSLVLGKKAHLTKTEARAALRVFLEKLQAHTFVREARFVCNAMNLSRRAFSSDEEWRGFWMNMVRNMKAPSDAENGER